MLCTRPRLGPGGSGKFAEGEPNEASWSADGRGYRVLV